MRMINLEERGGKCNCWIIKYLFSDLETCEYEAEISVLTSTLLHSIYVTGFLRL